MNLTSKILIAEDEGVIAEHLKLILNSIGFENVEVANDKERALAAIDLFKPDLVLLDIRMKNELDGIDIAKIINEKYMLPFIFISSHSDSEILDKAIDTKPAAYITKPFKKADIYAAITLAIKNKEIASSPYIIIKDGYNDVKIELDSVLYVQSERNYIDIYCKFKKYNTRNSLEWFMQNVSENQFMRVHRSYVINISMIQMLTSTDVSIDEKLIPISRKYLANIRSKIKS